MSHTWALLFLSLIIPAVAFTIIAGMELRNKPPPPAAPQPVEPPVRLAKILNISSAQAHAARSASPYAAPASVNDSSR